MIKGALGAGARFQRLDDGSIQVWARTEVGNSEYPFLEIKAQAALGEAGIYWAAVVATFSRLGFGVELKDDRLEIVPLSPGEPVKPEAH
jgi:hypothetical protein